MESKQGHLKETEFFTTAELAKMLKMNVQVITRKVQAGEIEAYKIGKDWRIPEFSVQKWLEQNSNKSRSEKTTRQKVGQRKSTTENNRERLPAQSSKRKFLLEYILAQFEPNRDYKENEVNRIINRYHEDHEAVREEFVSESMMERNNGHYRRRTGYKLSD